MARSTNDLEAQLIGAALRYVAVADWFESLSFMPGERVKFDDAMSVFNRVEEDLRYAGRGLFQRIGTRRIVLAQALHK